MVAKQMMSNRIVAIRDIVQMCFVGFSIQIEVSCCDWICSVIYSLQAIQLSAMLNFVILVEECKHEERTEVLGPK